MTTYFRDFSDADGISDWTPDRYLTGITWAVTGDVLGKGTTNSAEAITWDDIDGDANRAEIEVYGKFRTNNTASLTRSLCIVRASGTTTTNAEYYLLALRNTTLRALYKLNGGSATTISDPASGLTVAASTWYGYRFRVITDGATNRIYGRVWDASGSEPGTWQIDGASVTDSNISAAGWVGVMSSPATAEHEWQDFGVGTNGDTAPTSAGGGTFTTTGALSAQSASMAGSAAHLTLHTTTGALAADSATIVGAAEHPHTTAGSLVAQAATLAGSADHTAPGAFDTDGVLTAGSATLAGTAVRLALHTTTGALAASAATLAAAAVHLPAHQTTGALVAQSASMAGSSEHTVPGAFSTSGVLTAQAATLAGTAVRLGLHTTSGALTAGSAVIAGSSIHVGSGFTTEGTLVAQSASMAGVALRASAPEPADTTFTLRRSVASGSLRHSYRGKPARRGLE